MTALILALSLLAQPAMPPDTLSIIPPATTYSGPTLRIGTFFLASYPAMSDEKDFAEMTNDAGLDFTLGSVAWGGGIEMLGDAIPGKLRFRGSVGISRIQGAYKDEYDPLTYIILGVCTGGLAFLFGDTHDVIDLDDQELFFELEAYYIILDGSAFSFAAGIGPTYCSVRRQLDSPNTSTLGTGSSFGFITSLRIDQESDFKLGCIPVHFGLEAGYKSNNVTLSEPEANGFTVDFSGPFAKVGTYIGF